MEVVEDPDRLEAKGFDFGSECTCPRPCVNRLPAVIFTCPALWNDYSDLHTCAPLLSLFNALHSLLRHMKFPRMRRNSHGQDPSSRRRDARQAQGVSRGPRADASPARAT